MRIFNGLNGDIQTIFVAGWTMKNFIRICAAIAALVCFANPVFAGAIEISPLSLRISPPASVAPLNIRPIGKEPVKIQIRVFRWVDRSDPEALEPTTDLVASPPIAVMKPLVNYSVRIIRQINEPVEKETAYRMLIDVLPNEPLGTMAVGMGFQYSLPIYVQPSGAAKQKIDWVVERDEDNIIVSATNNGTISAQFRDLKVSDGKSNIDLGVKTAVTLGPGDTQSWTKPVPKSFNAPPAQITGKLGDKPFKASAGATQ